MFIFAPTALLKFLRRLMAGGEQAQNQADTPRNRKKKLLKKLRGKKGLPKYASSRLEAIANPPTEFEFTHNRHDDFETADEPPPPVVERRRDPVRLSTTAAAPVVAFAANEDAIVTELHARGDAIVHNLDVEATDLDNQIHAAMQTPGGLHTAEITQEANRLVAGSHEEINRLMNRVEEIERLSASAEAAAKQAPAPWWVSQLRRSSAPTAPAPSRHDRTQTAIHALPGYAHRQSLGKLAAPYSPSPRLQNFAKLTEFARSHFKPRQAAAATAATAARMAAVPSRNNLMAKFGRVRTALEGVQEEVISAEKHFKEELDHLAKTQQPKRNRRTAPRLSNELGAPKPKGPTVPGDPTKAGT